MDIDQNLPKFPLSPWKPFLVVLELFFVILSQNHPHMFTFPYPFVEGWVMDRQVGRTLLANIKRN